MNNDFNLLDVLKVLGRWKKHIIRTTIGVALLSVIGALLMPTFYKSSTTFYAAHPDLAKPEPVGGGESSKFIYGTGDDLDRLFSVANSSEIRNYLIGKFNLYEHYDIDSSKTKGPANMALQFTKLYNTTRTKYDAMILSMEDEDPVLARDIVRAAREKLSDRAQNLVKSSQNKSLTTSQANIKTQEIELTTINDNLIVLKSKYGIFDSQTQGEVFAQMITSVKSSLDQKEAQLKTLKTLHMSRDSIRIITSQIAGLKGKNASLRKTDSLYNAGILKVLALEQSQRRMADELSLEQERYKKLKASFDNPFTALHIVEKEEVPVEKSRPKRSIIVIGLTFLAFVLSCLGALVVDATKDINWKEIYHG